MELEEIIKQLKIMLECRKRQREEFKECLNCDNDIKALEITIKIFEEHTRILQILNGEVEVK